MSRHVIVSPKEKKRGKEKRKARPKKAKEKCKAGADIIVVGNAIEKDSALIKEIADAIHNI